MFKLPVVGAFGSRGSLASAHLSSFWAVNSNLECVMFTVDLVS